MGMFSPKQYLTGTNGLFREGDQFTLHNAKIDGTVNTPNGEKPQAKLLVSPADAPDQKTVVFTTGAGIVGQIQRMADGDLPAVVRLDAIPNTDPSRSATNVLTPADRPPPTGGGASAVGGPEDF